MYENDLRRYKNIIYCLESLVIETYFIGYLHEGEAILFFIKSDNNICFSGLIDCYKTKDMDIVTYILKKKQIISLDFICWTHPDLDHSKGLKDVIDSYASRHTYIWIPESIDTEDIVCSEEVKRLFISLKQYVISTEATLNVFSISDIKDMMAYNSLCFINNINLYPLKLISYAPNSKIIRKQNYLEKYIKNDRSIFFVLALGKTRILFTGDVENDTIKQIPKEHFEQHVHILKIPHHGSSTSTKMLELISGNCDIACSTVYRKGNSSLPEAEVMEAYKEKSTELYCTGKSAPEQESEKFGIVKVVTDVLKNSYSALPIGNAEIWNNK